MSAVARHLLCLVEDDEIMGESLVDRFQLEGFDVDWWQEGGSGMAAIRSRPYAAVISDMRLPDIGGDRVFEQLLGEGRGLPPFVFITGHGTIERAVHLLKLGAADFVTKPFDLDQLVEKVRALCSVPAAQGAADAPLGVSPAMRRIEDGLSRIAVRATSVLISGESGVGKERVAGLLHRRAHTGAEVPFVAVNCGALPESLMEAELFGYEKGAFTGAVKARRGYFEQAHGGTLFLDEIGEMPPAMQVKLLRAIQERRITRVGAEAPVPAEFRLVCATHRDLRQMVEEGQFREDLYYRINVIHLRIPPLRERRDDILWLARRFLEEFSAGQRDGRRALSPAAERALLEYPWPGNVRELRHCLERACILGAANVLAPEDLFEELPAPAAAGEPAGLAEHLAQCEKAYIERSLARHGGQIAATAAALGISRKNLWEKMRKLGISGHGEGVD